MCIFCMIANHEINSSIIYEDDKYNDTPSDRASKRMLDAAGVTYKKIPVFEIQIP